MSGMVLTPVSPAPEKSMDRPGRASDVDHGAEGFDEISAREQSRLDRKDARQDRADRHAEDQRVAEKRAEKAERADESASADKSDAPKERDNTAKDADSAEEKTAAETGKTEQAAKAGDGKSTDDSDGDIKGDEALPILFSVPAAITPEKTPASVTTTGESTAAMSAKGMPGAPVNGQMLTTSASGKLDAGADGGTDGLLQGKSDTIATLLGKGAAGDDKAADFSAQLARFQGGDSSSQQNNATQLQRGLEGRESMASLKTYATSVDLPVQHAEWGEKVAGKLAWLTSQRMSAAEIHVTPPDLGPLEVRVQVHHDQAQVTVHATHAAVRDQLELSGHRLRDMLQDNGLNLDRFEVSADASGQGAQQQLQEDQGQGGNGQGLADSSEGDMPDESLAGGSLDLSWRGEVDLYA